MTVFISFSSADRKIAEKVYDRLKAKGVESWISTRDIPAGADYQACIVEAIERSMLVVLVFSSRANASPEIAKELALASRKVLIPARIEDVVPQGSFQYQLSNRQFVDLFEDFDQKLDELVVRIKAVVEGKSDITVQSSPKRNKRRAFTYAAILIAGMAVLGSGTFAVLNAISAKVATNYSPPANTPPTTPVIREAADVNNNSAAKIAAKQTLAIISPSTNPTPSPVVTLLPLGQEPRADENVNATPQQRSEKTKLVLAMLGDTKNYDRAQAIGTSAPQLPDVLTAAEAEVLLEGTFNSRPAAIAVLASRLPILGGKDAASVLGTTTNYDRLVSLGHLTQANKIRRDLEPVEVDAVLASLNNSRTAGVAGLAPLIRSNLTGLNAELILGKLTNYDRLKAIESLTQAQRIKKLLPAEDARLILEGTNNSRPDAIGLLAPLLQEKMDGKSTAAILGTISNYDRYLALNHLVRARRISGILRPEDMEAILNGIGNSRGDALKSLASLSSNP